MKKIFAAAIAALLFAAPSMFAADPANCSRKNCQQQNCQQPNCTQQPCQQVCDRATLNCQRPCPFDGLNLTADQQARIKALQETCRAENRQDKADRKAEKARQRDDRRRQYLNNVKEILTPEQYVTFLENNFINGGGHKAPRHDKMARRGNFSKDRKMAKASKDVKSSKEGRIAKSDKK